MQVKHTEQSTLWAWSNGLNEVPAPCEVYWSFKPLRGSDGKRYETLEHQKRTAGFFSVYKKAITTSGLGSGKSHCIASTIDYLKSHSMIEKCIIIAPLSILRQWVAGLFDSFPEYTTSLLLGSAKRRKEMLWDATDIKVINIDGLEVIKDDLAKWIDNKTLVVLDEASVIKASDNGLSQRAKLFMKLVTGDCRVILASATPAPQKLYRSWSLCKVINPMTPKYFGQYKALCAYKYGPFEWKERPEAPQVVAKYLQPCIHFDKEDIVGMPPLTYERREIEPSDAQKGHLKTLRNDMMMQLGDIEHLAVNAAVVFGKVMQVMLGVIKVDDEYITIDGFQKRVDEIADIAEQRGRKILVSVAYKGAIIEYHKALKAKGFRCEYINGDVDSKKRSELFVQFQDTDSIDILLVHFAVASHGINAQSCDTLVLTGPIASAEAATQLVGRINRMGQKNSMTVIQFYGDKTEQKIYDKLEKSDENQNAVLDLMREFVQET